MTEEERITKYVNFANRLYEDAKKKELTNVIDRCKMNRMDTHFFSALVKEGHFVRLKGGGYGTERLIPFESQEINEILLDLALRVKVNALNSIPQEKKAEEPRVISPFRPLSEYTPRELIDELKRRGYSGKLIFTKEIKF
jgi:hypothetical protein